MAASVPPASWVVLIVEDEPLLMMEAVDIVTEAGFLALEATSAAAAIGILERRADIAVVFADVQLAGDVDGVRLARLVRDRWPPIKLIVASGRVTVRAEDLPAASVFLPKPYRAAEVHRMLDRLLGEAA